MTTRPPPPTPPARFTLPAGRQSPVYRPQDAYTVSSGADFASRRRAPHGAVGATDISRSRGAAARAFGASQPQAFSPYSRYCCWLTDLFHRPRLGQSRRHNGDSIAANIYLHETSAVADYGRVGTSTTLSLPCVTAAFIPAVTINCRTKFLMRALCLSISPLRHASARHGGRRLDCLPARMVSSLFFRRCRCCPSAEEGFIFEAILVTRCVGRAEPTRRGGHCRSIACLAPPPPGASGRAAAAYLGIDDVVFGSPATSGRFDASLPGAQGPFSRHGRVYHLLFRLSGCRTSLWRFLATRRRRDDSPMRGVTRGVAACWR